MDTNEDRALAQARFVADLPFAAAEVEATLRFVFRGEGEEIPEELERFKSAPRVPAVRRARDHRTDHGVCVSIADGSGDTAADIVDVADALDAEMIVMGGRKRSPAATVVSGSVTQTVRRTTDRPVVVTGRSETAEE